MLKYLKWLLDNKNGYVATLPVSISNNPSLVHAGALSGRGASGRGSGPLALVFAFLGPCVVRSHRRVRGANANCVMGVITQLLRQLGLPALWRGGREVSACVPFVGQYGRGGGVEGRGG